MTNHSQQIAELIRQGKKLEAIKLLRETTGIDLKEAKEQIEHLMSGSTPDNAEHPAGAGAEKLPDDVLALAQAGKKIEAIKLLREQSGLGLKDAKDRIDAVMGKGSGCASTIVLLLVVLVGLIALLG